MIREELILIECVARGLARKYLSENINEIPPDIQGDIRTKIHGMLSPEAGNSPMLDALVRLVHAEAEELLREWQKALKKTELPDPVLSIARPSEEELDIPLERNAWSIHAWKAFRRLEIRSLRELIQVTAEDLLNVHKFGEGSLAEVKQKLAAKGLRLKQKPA